MPTYEYACNDCGEHLEVVQSFSDEPLKKCPSCKGKLRKVFSPVGIVFKGSGFYKTDNRTGRPKSETKSDGKADKPEGSSTPAKTDAAPASDSKPAPKAAEAKTA